jgi:hypothetical protein
VCPNVFLLGSRWSLASISNGSANTSTEFEGKNSIVTTSQRLTIASFGGCYNPDTFRAGKGAEAFDLSYPSFNSTNLASFLSSPSLPSIGASAEPSLSMAKTSTSTSQIDILLTNNWPSSITRLSKTSPPVPEGSWAAPPLDDVVKACRPRYHFAAAGGSPPIFWEREPFLWEAGQITRFVGLGAFGDLIGVPAATKKPRVGCLLWRLPHGQLICSHSIHIVVLRGVDSPTYNLISPFTPTYERYFMPIPYGFHKGREAGHR